MYLCRYWRHIDKASKELSYRRENLKDLVEVPPAVLASTSPDKKEEAIDNLGADSFLGAMSTMDGIIDTISAVYPFMPLIGL
ncbi:hypothetical protein G4B88_006629 [Cannabis sativa]|uniref:Uncharacterized protein n=1 Tax=Cannabis sativa TaxID=3483 RepID=A0A7J6GGP3_CANSA|nr:hypothetical protein G4B88_006629 [Cannabis sativa]